MSRVLFWPWNLEFEVPVRHPGRTDVQGIWIAESGFICL